MEVLRWAFHDGVSAIPLNEVRQSLCMSGLSKHFLCRYLMSTTHQSIGASFAPQSSHHDGIISGSVVGDISSLEMAKVLLAVDDTGSVSIHPSLTPITT